MSNLYDEIKVLFDNQLYSNVISLASFALTIADSNPADNICPGKFQTYVYYGDSLFHLGHYRRAEAMYVRALEVRKEFFKHVGKSQTNPKEFIDIKYQIHLCHLNLKQNKEAITVLETIPGKHRTAKVNMALGKLYQQGGMERSAISAYKEVLKDCPLALEAIEGLLNLGIHGSEVQALVLKFTTERGIENIDWLMTWIKTQDQINRRDYNQAVVTLKSLEKQSCIRNNHNLVVALGEAYYYNGDTKNSLLTLQRAHLLDPLAERSIDMLAALLAKEKKYFELEKLVPIYVQPTEYGSETWVAMAYHLYVNKKSTRAAYLAQKACLINPRNIEALLLKGAIFLDLKKYQDAVVHYREVLHLSPYRFEAHRGLVNCYTAMHRFREALTIASSVCKQLGQTSRTLTLYGSVLMKDPVSVCKARNLLEKALQLDDTYLPAVYLLVNIYEQEMNTDGIITLLEKQTKLQPSCRLHQMLADAYVRNKQEDKALEHFIIALQIEPGNRRALEGMSRIDQSCNKIDPSYYMSVNEEDNLNNTCELGDSDNENEGEESELDFAWSDLDVGLNSL